MKDLELIMETLYARRKYTLIQFRVTNPPTICLGEGGKKTREARGNPAAETLKLWCHTSRHQNWVFIWHCDGSAKSVWNGACSEVQSHILNFTTISKWEKIYLACTYVLEKTGSYIYNLWQTLLSRASNNLSHFIQQRNSGLKTLLGEQHWDLVDLGFKLTPFQSEIQYLNQ